jgi:hypothetical protein
MNIKTRSAGSLPFFVILVMVSLVPSHALSGDLVSISTKNIDLGKYNRIANFELNIRAGSVYSFSRVPQGWEIFIDNQPSRNTRVTGGAVVGAAGLDIDFFEEEFLVVEKDTDYNPGMFRIELVLYTTSNFEDVKKYYVDSKNIVLKKMPSPARTKDRKKSPGKDAGTKTPGS